MGSGSGEGVQSLLQLPHMDLNLVKKLNNRKIRYACRLHGAGHAVADA